MTQRPAIDWDGIHAAYAAGISTLRDIAERFGVSHVTIIRRAAREGWVRADPAKVGDLVNALAAANQAGLPKATKLPSLVAELDRLASLKLKMERNAEMIADAIPAMLAQCESMQEIQQAARAHRDLHETHFGKAGAPDVQVNTQNNQVVLIDAPDL